MPVRIDDPLVLFPFEYFSLFNRSGDTLGQIRAGERTGFSLLGRTNVAQCTRPAFVSPHRLKESLISGDTVEPRYNEFLIWPLKYVIKRLLYIEFTWFTHTHTHTHLNRLLLTGQFRMKLTLRRSLTKVLAPS